MRWECIYFNEHGEADYAIWHYCMYSPSNISFIVSRDTDTWVCGQEIHETGHSDINKPSSKEAIAITLFNNHRSPTSDTAICHNLVHVYSLAVITLAFSTDIQ